MSFLKSNNGGLQEPLLVILSLLTGVVLVFMLVMAGYLKSSPQREVVKIRKIAIDYNAQQDALYKTLKTEFKDDFKKWNATIDRETLSIRFRSPSVLFEGGRSDLKKRFKQILDSFFPRYIEILKSSEFRDDIEEVRIEGHTSSEWLKGVYGLKAYFNNMELSQDRTRVVLEYVLHRLHKKKLSKDDGRWLKSVLTANGLSSSQVVRTDGKEDVRRSRRVEFRVRTKSEQKMQQILSE
ncbi:MAG: OmpA/MotB family protein [Alphaproteobacteria bacterium]